MDGAKLLQKPSTTEAAERASFADKPVIPPDAPMTSGGISCKTAGKKKVVNVVIESWTPWRLREKRLCAIGTFKNAEAR